MARSRKPRSKPALKRIAAALPTISIVEKFTEDFEMYLARQEVMV